MNKMNLFIEHYFFISYIIYFSFKKYFFYNTIHFCSLCNIFLLIVYSSIFEICSCFFIPSIRGKRKAQYVRRKQPHFWYGEIIISRLFGREKDMQKIVYSCEKTVAFRELHVAFSQKKPPFFDRRKGNQYLLHHPDSRKLFYE